MKRRKGFTRWFLNLILKYLYLIDISFSVVQALHSKVEIILKPDDSTVPLATNINFFCRASGYPAPRIIWKKDDKTVRSTEKRYTINALPNGLSTLRIEHVSLDDSGTITCYAYNENGRFASIDAKLTVLPESQLPKGFPSIKIHPQLKSFEKGTTAIVPCVYEGDPKLKVLWLRDQRPLDIRTVERYSISKLSKEGAGTLMIQNATDADQGEYECVVRNSHGVRHSQAARIFVKVRQVAPIFTLQPQPVYKVESGGSVNLTCAANGYPMPRVFWKKTAGNPLMDPSTAPYLKNVLELTRVMETENYTCVAVSRLGDIEANTTVEVKALPSPPRNLQISNIQASSVTLSWMPGHVENGEPVTSYIIRYRQKGSPLNSDSSMFDQYEESGPYKEKEIPAVTTQYTIEGLRPYQIYEFFVFAKSVIGRGLASPIKEAQTDESPPSSPPRKIEARPLNKNSIIIHWEHPEKPNGKITGYKIFYTNIDKSAPITVWNQRHTDKQTETLYNLETNRTYYILIQALNSKGAGPLSRIVTVITRHGLPGQPMELTAKALDANRIQLKWEKPVYTFGIVGYSVQYNSSEKHFPEIVLNAATESVIVTRLSANTYYSFRVAARTGPGLGAYCEYVTAKTHQSVPTGAPKIEQLNAISSRSLLVIWRAPPEKDRNGALIDYLIKWRSVTRQDLLDATDSSEESEAESEYENDTEDNSDERNNAQNSVKKWSQITQRAGRNTSAVIEELSPFTVYEVTVTAGTEKGYGPDSDPWRNRTFSDG